MAGEIGGGNGLIPVTWAARMGLPVVDADGMGRAFPLVSQVTMELAGISPCPAVMTDERGNVVVFRAISGNWVERLERAAAAELGGMGQATDFPLTAAQAREATVRGSVSQAIRIGQAVANVADSPVAAVIAAAGAFRLVGGKVLDVRREVAEGFMRGSVVIEGLGEDAGRLIRLELQNEHLVALERGRLLASVPDLITVLDSTTADAISADRIRYGQRVVVIAFGCDPVLADRTRDRGRRPAGVRIRLRLRAGGATRRGRRPVAAIASEHGRAGGTGRGWVLFCTCLSSGGTSCCSPARP